jgi:hypothetical protein
MRMADLQTGWSVLGNDGRQLGAVQRVGQNYLVVSRGVFAADLYVPASAIANVEHEAVHLNLAKRDAEGMGWEQPPREPDASEPAGEADDLHRHV